MTNQSLFTYQNYPAIKLGSTDGLEATYIPGANMLCPSLTYRGAELLHMRSSVKDYRESGKTTGLPLLFPWANRLGGLEYEFEGTQVVLNPHDSTLKITPEGYAMHGLMPSTLNWIVVASDATSLTAELNFDPSVSSFKNFPFAHTLTQNIKVTVQTLTVTTTVTPTGAANVPVAFGYHPYFKLPSSPRGDWELNLPVTRHIILEDQLPNGTIKPISPLTGPLSQSVYDDCYEMPSEPLAISTDNITLEMSSSSNYHYAQIYAPEDSPFICLEPMTSPPDPFGKLATTLPVATPDQPYEASFTVKIIGR